MDLGFSTRQMDAEGRGFSFGRDEPLDMRFDPTSDPSAAVLVADADAAELAHVLRTFGEEPNARRIAARLVDARVQGPVRTTCQLADLVARAVHGRHGRLHPATRTFQALRIAVNDELGALSEALPQAVREALPEVDSLNPDLASLARFVRDGKPTPSLKVPATLLPTLRDCRANRSDRLGLLKRWMQANLQRANRWWRDDGLCRRLQQAVDTYRNAAAHTGRFTPFAAQKAVA